MADRPGKTVLRRQLGRELRRLRETTGLTINEVAPHIGIKGPTISKIENGRQAIREPNVRLMLQLYRVTGRQAEELLERVAEANAPDPYAAFTDVRPNWAARFVDLEADASEILGYDTELIPGQLQTPGYVRALRLAAAPGSSEDDLARSVEFRQRRQELTVADRTRLRFVLNEGAVRRLVGGPEVMCEQITHLADVSRLPHVTIQVLPFGAGAHPAMGITFALLRFADDEDLDVVYLEHDRGALYLEGPDDVERYGVIFERLTRAALNGVATRKLLATVSNELRASE